MEFHDLKRQYNALREEIVWRVGRVAEEGRFIGGCEVEELEERLARYAGVRHCVSCGNGTDALTLMLAAAGMLIVIARHRENIVRLINGTEPDFKPAKRPVTKRKEEC